MPLVKLIDPYIDRKLKQLPADLRQLVTKKFLPHWDGLTPNRRRSVATQYDYEHDPTMDRENEYWWNLSCAISDTEARLEKWKLMNDRSLPTEASVQESKLESLTRRLTNLEKLWKQSAFAVDSFEDLSEEALHRATNGTFTTEIIRVKHPNSSRDIEGFRERLASTLSSTFSPQVSETTSGSTALDTPTKQGRTNQVGKYKKNVLIDRLLANWPNINNDFRHGIKNRLIPACRVQGEYGYYLEEPAIAWAQTNGKWIEREVPSKTANLMAYVPGKRHTTK